MTDRPDPTYNPGRRTSFRQTHGPALFMMTGIVLALVFVSLWTLSRTVKNHPERVRLGKSVFTVGGDARYGPIVDKDGPILFQALLGTKDIYVQHLGSKKWTTFAAVAPGADRVCQLRWDRTRKLFTDPCVAGRTFPSDGTGLPHYLTKLDAKDRIVIDLNEPTAAPRRTTLSR